MATDEEKQAVVKLMAAVVEACDMADPLIGAPGGILYAGLMDFMGLAEFDNLMHGMVHAGALLKRGQCYFVTDTGRQFAKIVSAKTAN